MKLDVCVHNGKADRPAIIFIHGLGMDKNIWVNPLNSRILGGMFPLEVLLKKSFSDGKPVTLFDIFRDKGYSVVAWSQKRPAGPIESAAAELDEMVGTAGCITPAGVILIGHSRGGLIARKYLMNDAASIQALITISTPHKGSSVAKLAKYVSPIVTWLTPLIPKGERGTLRFAVSRVLEFLKSKALRELLPGSNFFKSLADRPVKGVYYASIGGTNPTLFRLSGLSMPDIFERMIPEKMFPEEMKQGKGDGLVSAASSIIPWCDEHHDFELNHAEILFDDEVKETVVNAVERIG
ncbi:MAG: alpha/beta fold hydrolase [Nitrospirota bacterium]